MNNSGVQGVTSSTPVFAYLRRSTRNKQEISLENQADNIDLIIKAHGLDKKNITFFAESRSAYEGIKQKWGKILRKRTEFTRLLQAIDESKRKCVVLVRDSSRLSRNKLDNIEITKRLFWEFGNPKKIEKIIFYVWESWNAESDKVKVDNELMGNYHSSITTARLSKEGVLAQLRRGNYVYNPPAGLTRVKRGSTVLLQWNEKMPCVIRAFEMKADGKGHKEISNFLRCMGVPIGERDLTDRLFTNTIYIGSYTYASTGEIFNLAFEDGRPPVSLVLWNKVQAVLNRKVSKYWDKQEGDIFAEKLRTASGKRMSTYLAKGKYRQYKNAIENINIAEWVVLKAFVDEIRDFLNALAFKHLKHINADLKKELTESAYRMGLEDFVEGTGRTGEETVQALQGLLYEELSAEQRDLFERRGLSREGLSRDFLVNWGFRLSEKRAATFRESFRQDTWIDLSEWLGEALALDSFKEKTRDALVSDFSRTLRNKFDSENKDFQAIKTEQISMLHNKKREAVGMRVNMVKLVAKGALSEEIYAEAVVDVEKDIKLIDEQINELSEGSDMEMYLRRLPKVLTETFELMGNMLHEAKNTDKRDDLFKLVELTTFELTVNNKKELKVKLFDVLDSLISSDDSALEAPSGVEPLSTALQAAV